MLTVYFVRLRSIGAHAGRLRSAPIAQETGMGAFLVSGHPENAQEFHVGAVFCLSSLSLGSDDLFCSEIVGGEGLGGANIVGCQPRMIG